MIQKQELRRFWKRIKRFNDCWVWEGANRRGRIRNGKSNSYSTCTFKGKNESVHRIFYEAYKGKIKMGLEIDHLCRNTLCVNPTHLEAITHAENCRRGTSWHHFVEKAKLITRCPQGHEYTKENTYITPKKPTRHCRTCVRNRSREYQRRKAHEQTS